MSSKCKVLIVDDSASVRQTLTELLNSDDRLEVIAVAADPYIAAGKIQQQLPDVILLDLELPRMDGLTFLKRLMAQHPIPVVICSSFAAKGSAKAFEALEAGAVEVVDKPKFGAKQFFEETRDALCDVVMAASIANLRQKLSDHIPPKLTADVIIPQRATTFRSDRDHAHSGERPKLIAIGASTGGTQALSTLLTALPNDTPGIVIVQHMPEGFTAMFAQRLNKICKMEIREAKDGDAIETGLVLIAPGNFHLLVRSKGNGFAAEIKAGPPVSRHRPSVDVLFRSVAQTAGPSAVGVILTGMGDDGAKGMLEMHQAGAYTVAQDSESCVVFGMPNEAIKLGGVDRISSLEDVAPLLVSLAHGGARARAVQKPEVGKLMAGEKR